MFESAHCSCITTRVFCPLYDIIGMYKINMYSDVGKNKIGEIVKFVYRNSIKSATSTNFVMG